MNIENSDYDDGPPESNEGMLDDGTLVVLLDEFRDMCNSGSLTDYDGSAYFGTATQELGVKLSCSTAGRSPPKPEYTHVWWYNK